MDEVTGRKRRLGGVERGEIGDAAVAARLPYRHEHVWLRDDVELVVDDPVRSIEAAREQHHREQVRAVRLERRPSVPAVATRGAKDVHPFGVEPGRDASEDVFVRGIDEVDPARAGHAREPNARESPRLRP